MRPLNPVLALVALAGRWRWRCGCRSAGAPWEHISRIGGEAEIDVCVAVLENLRAAPHCPAVRVFLQLAAAKINPDIRVELGL